MILVSRLVIVGRFYWCDSGEWWYILKTWLIWLCKCEDTDDDDNDHHDDHDDHDEHDDHDDHVHNNDNADNDGDGTSYWVMKCFQEMRERSCFFNSLLVCLFWLYATAAVAVAEGFAHCGIGLNNWWWKRRLWRLGTSYGDKQWHWWRTWTSCSYLTVRQRWGPIARQILSILLSCHHDHDANGDHGDHVHDDIGQYLWGLEKEFVQVQNVSKIWFVIST